MTRVASLGMYDGPALRAANDASWASIAERLSGRGMADVPATLDRDRPLDAIWRDPRLLLAQCCGYPLATRFRDVLRVVATPRYAAEGCTGADHRSRLVVRASAPLETLVDLQGARAAINDRGSNSGMNLFRNAVAPLADGGRFFARVVETGSHEASVRAIVAGEADVAAIDAVSFAHVDPALAAGVRTIGWTEPSPSLPFVTAVETPEHEVRLLREALDDVLRGAETQPIRARLLIDGADEMPGEDYDRLLDLERRAVRLGYPELA